MSKQNLNEFIELLETKEKKVLKVETTTKKGLNVTPLSFKQQKSLITPSLDGIAGVMVFIKNLNDIILENSDEKELKIYDRVPIALAFRKNLTTKKIEQDDHKIDVNDLIANFKKFELPESETINEDDYSITLRIPTLKQENRLLTICIENLKKLDVDNLGKNVDMILSYEIPKFIDNVKFSDKVIVFDDLSIADRTKIMDNLPATVTNAITDYILKVREYDESLLTHGGVTVDLDSSFFE